MSNNMKIEKMNIKGMDVIKVEIPMGYEYSGVDIDGNLIMTKKKPSYPKNISDCCEIHNMPYTGNGYISATMLGVPINNLAMLLVARNAYWKVAGEQMGLGKPWKPDWTTSGQDRYTIETNFNEFIFSKTRYGHRVLLVFPTEEMRDAFYDNFKTLIESCKDLL